MLQWLQARFRLMDSLHLVPLFASQTCSHSGSPSPVTTNLPSSPVTQPLHFQPHYYVLQSMGRTGWARQTYIFTLSSVPAPTSHLPPFPSREALFLRSLQDQLRISGSSRVFPPGSLEPVQGLWASCVLFQIHLFTFLLPDYPPTPI